MMCRELPVSHFKIDSDSRSHISSAHNGIQDESAWSQFASSPIPNPLNVRAQYQKSDLYYSNHHRYSHIVLEGVPSTSLISANACQDIPALTWQKVTNICAVVSLNLGAAYPT